MKYILNIFLLKLFILQSFNFTCLASDDSNQNTWRKRALENTKIKRQRALQRGDLGIYPMTPR